MDNNPTSPVAEAISKPKWRKRILISILAIVALLVLIRLLPVFLNLVTRDDEFLDNSDLILKKVSIPDNENDYFDLVKIGEVYTGGLDKYLNQSM